MYKLLSQDSIKDKLSEKITALDRQLEALAEHLSKMPKGLDPKPVFSEMQKIEELKEKTRIEFERELEKEELEQPPIGFDNYMAVLKRIKTVLAKESNHELKRKVCEKLIHKIELLPEGFKLHFYMGASHFDGPLKDSTNKKRARGSFSDPSPLAQDDILIFFGSNTLSFPTHR